MEFLRVVKRRSLLSESVYILLNLALAGIVVGAVMATGTPWLALAFVLLSKWRVLAVRPRYWLAHIETNMVDFIVSIGVVVMMYSVGQSGTHTAGLVQLLLAVLYALWLLLLKPRSKRAYVIAQAGVAVLVGTIALAGLSYEWSSSVVVALMWVIGYSASRHVMNAYDEQDIRLFSFIWGFVFAQVGWLYYHWMIAYVLPFSSGIKLPQVTIILLALSFVGERIYAAYAKHEKITSSDIMLPALLSLGLLFVLEVFFNAAAIGAA